MKVYEIVKIGQKMLSLLQNSCVSIADCELLPMYEEYQKLVCDGGKKSMVVTYLAKKYFISERRVWYLIKKFEHECKIGAW